MRGRLAPFHIKHASLPAPPELVIETLAALLTSLLVWFPSANLLNSGPFISFFISHQAGHFQLQEEENTRFQQLATSAVSTPVFWAGHHQAASTSPWISWKHSGALLTVPLCFPGFGLLVFTLFSFLNFHFPPPPLPHLSNCLFSSLFLFFSLFFFWQVMGSRRFRWISTCP